MTANADTARPPVAGVRHGRPPAPAKRRRRGALGSKAAYVYIAPFFVLFGVFGLYPFIYTAWVSLHDVTLSRPNDMTWVGLANYTNLLTSDFFWNALKNTVTIGIISTVPQLMMALGIAHLLNYKLRGRTFFRVAMLMPYATSIASATLIFSMLFGRDFGLINWFLGLFGVDAIDWHNGHWTAQIAVSTIVTWRWTGYNALIYLAGMQAIPNELYESTAIDGANRWQQFRYVTLPGLRPTILLTVVISTIGATQLFGEPLLFDYGNTSGGPLHQFQTIALLMYQQGWTYYHLGTSAAIGWLIFLIAGLFVAINLFITRRVARDTDG